MWGVFICPQESKVHGANMGPTWVLSAPDGPYVGPMNLAIRVPLKPAPGIQVLKYVLHNSPCGKSLEWERMHLINDHVRVSIDSLFTER